MVRALSLATTLAVLSVPVAGTTLVEAAGAMAFHPRYAYMTVHYEGTPSDDEYVLGVRVLVQSIMLNAKPGPDVDVVVLCSAEVRKASRDSFAALGAKILPVEHVQHSYDTGLHETYKPRFMHAMNKLQLWSLTQYERIIYLDADCVVVRSMDILFHSAAFGAVMNANGFIHTGLLVVKPDNAMHQKLLDMVASTWSRDGADQGFLISVFNDDIEDAPNFNPQTVEEAEKKFAPLPFNRIKVNFDLPAVYWYERFSWATLRAVHPAFVDMDIPAYALTYSMGETLKPWYWYSYPLLENNAPWLDVRLTLPGEASQWHWAAARRLAVLAFLAAILWAADRKARQASVLSAKTGSGSSAALLGGGSSGGNGSGSNGSDIEKSFMAATAEIVGFGALAVAFAGGFCALLPWLAPGLMPPHDAYTVAFAAYPLALASWGWAASKAAGQALPPPLWLTAGPQTALATLYLGLGYHPFYDMGTAVPGALRVLSFLLLLQLNLVAVAAYLRLAVDLRRLRPAARAVVRLPR